MQDLIIHTTLIINPGEFTGREVLVSHVLRITGLNLVPRVMATDPFKTATVEEYL